jgi:hypothetical protein
MSNDFNKYRAQILQTSGFALMIPFGRVMLKLLDNESNDINIQFFIVLFVSVMIAFCGIMLLLKGLECVETRDMK